MGVKVDDTIQSGLRMAGKTSNPKLRTNQNRFNSTIMEQFDLGFMRSPRLICQRTLILFVYSTKKILRCRQFLNLLNLRHSACFGVRLFLEGVGVV